MAVASFSTKSLQVNDTSRMSLPPLGPTWAALFVRREALQLMWLLSLRHGGITAHHCPCSNEQPLKEPPWEHSRDFAPGILGHRLVQQMLRATAIH